MSYLEENLEVILITYNRKNKLQSTLEQCFCENSPIKNVDFTIIDNCSDDGTLELCDEYAKQYSNVKHIVNKMNIGGNANICRAMECASKKYVWFLCDDDNYYWENWQEVEGALKSDNYDAIFVRNLGVKTANLFFNANFLAAVIYKSEIITPTLIENAYFNLHNMFPHLALISEVINTDGNSFVVQKSIVKPGAGSTVANFKRGLNVEKVSDTKANMLWGVGYLNSLELIKDLHKRAEIIDGICHHIPTLFKNPYEFFRLTLIVNYLICNNFKFNKTQLKRFLNCKQKLTFFKAELLLGLRILFVNKKLYFENTTEVNWEQYFENVDEQKYIDKLAKKYKNKRILIYGTGKIFQILNEKYDLSALNITAVSDGAFKQNGEFLKYKSITPENIKNEDFDVILFTLYRDKEIVENFKNKGITINSKSLIKHSLKVFWNL